MDDKHIIYRSKFEKESDEFLFNSLVDISSWFFANPLWGLVLLLSLFALVFLKIKFF